MTRKTTHPPAALSATDMERAIFTALAAHASKSHPMPIGRVYAHTGQPAALVRPALTALVHRRTVTHARAGYYITTTPASPASKPSVAAPRVICNAAMPTGDAEYWRRLLNTGPKIRNTSQG